MGPRRLYEDDNTIVDLHLSAVRYTPNPKHPDLNCSNETVLNQCEIVYCCNDGGQTKINLKKTLRGCVRKVHIHYLYNALYIRNIRYHGIIISLHI